MRDRLFDNYKAILIILVVFAHAIEALIPEWEKHYIIHYIYFTIFCFHMPAFTFVSGYFSNPSRHKSVDSTGKLLMSYLLPYFLMNILYSVLGVLIEEAPPKSIFILFLPQWTMWYLLSLFFWKASLKYLYAIKFAMPVSLLLSLYIGLTQADTFFSISRTICFSPFFLFGSMISPAVISKIRDIKKAVFILLFLFCLASSALLMSFGPTSALYMMMPYEEMGQSPLMGILFRAGAMTIGFAFIVCIISLTSKKESRLTTLGEYSFPIYLLHSGLLRILAATEFKTNNVVVQMVILCVLTIIICFALGNSKVNAMVRKTIYTIGNIALKNKA